MKEFEKKWHKEFETEPDWEYKPISQECKKVAKIYWKHALEWVLFLQEAYGIEGEIFEDIKSELNDETTTT